MGLVLSARKRSDLGELLRILLSPLEHADLPTLGRTITTALARSFETGSGMCALPDGTGGMRLFFSGLDPTMAERLEGLVVGTRPGTNVFTDPLVDRALGRLAAARIEVWNVPVSNRFTGIPLERTAAYSELIVPARVGDMTIVGVPLPAGYAMLGAACRRRGYDPSGEESLELAELLVPAFRTGLRGLLACGTYRASLEALLDRCRVGASVRDDTGREIYRNRALERLLAADPERARIRDAVDGLVRDLVRLRDENRVAAGPHPIAARPDRVSTARGRYHIGISHLPAGSFARGRSLVITVSSAAPILPEPLDLRERFGLTAREAEVALLLAGGASNREISERLGLSAHTVRHHAQRVLEKVGVHSRKALALELMAGI